MKIITIHSDFIEVVAKKRAIKDADEKPENIKQEETLVVFIAAEIDDSEESSGQLTDEIIKISDQVKTKNIMLYPYVHLTEKPSKPDLAKKILEKTKEELENKGFEVKKAPFGWYKQFHIKSKGHPLSELSRVISANKETKDVSKEKQEESEAVKKEGELKSDWYILDPSGKLHSIKTDKDKKKVEGYKFEKDSNLEKFAKYELAKSRQVDIEPPHIALMRKLELVDYEEGSDLGNFRYYPKGKLLKSLIEEYVVQKTIDYGAVEVETPIMYDYEHPSLKSYLNRFPARQYSIQTPNKKVFLRFAACFGQFLIAKDATISYKQLPLPIFELTRYSFRVEQSGELAGLRRLRTFTMPDCHCLCKDMDQAKQEFLKRFDLAVEVQKGLSFSKEKDLEFAIRITQEFFDENKEYIINLVKKWGKPALIEIWNKRFFYFVLKYEFNFVDALEKAAALTTDQIDVENAQRYNIMYTDQDNQKKHPLILHLSPSGAVERVIYALLEKSYLEQKQGKTPTLPLWLCPTQVRLCPINDSFILACEKIAQRLEKENIRVDIDDRSERINKKIADSQKEWIPLILVIGEKEAKGEYQVRIRDTGKVEQMDEKILISYIKKRTNDYPFKKLSLSKYLTKRPIFVG